MPNFEEVGLFTTDSEPEPAAQAGEKQDHRGGEVVTESNTTEPTTLHSLRELQKRRAVVRLGEDALERMIDLPEGLIIAGYKPNILTRSIDIYIFGAGLERVPDFVEAPYISSNAVFDADTQTIKIEFQYPVEAENEDINEVPGDE